MSNIKKNFGRIWPVHVDALIVLMSRLRASFDGDLDEALIMAVIGSAALPRGRVPHDLSYEDFVHMARPKGFDVPLNTHSIAQITGIARETVRRKTGRLQSRGWIERGVDGYWKVAEAGAQELEPMTQLSLDYLTALSRVIFEDDIPHEPRRSRRAAASERD
ncbi:MAG: helix-turn-helix domain-containing protein [Erythrobacter sp.]|uniref:helix-turn-helix domain-containing protein n=1 Tax=Erythrobacter sp. TaxID=1042 RepID=UPI0032EBFABD